jgi:hypothetical protein
MRAHRDAPLPSRIPDVSDQSCKSSWSNEFDPTGWTFHRVQRRQLQTCAGASRCAPLLKKRYQKLYTMSWHKVYTISWHCTTPCPYDFRLIVIDRAIRGQILFSSCSWWIKFFFLLAFLCVLCVPSTYSGQAFAVQTGFCGRTAPPSSRGAGSSRPYGLQFAVFLSGCLTG